MRHLSTTAISILAFAIGLTSCSDRDFLKELDDVESYINERPDSALIVLDSLARTEIKGREARAEFALLYSAALDKSYIDVKDDSLINIAVDWYRRHGTSDERMKAYYYQGRVYQNAGDNEAAMESFVKAEADALKSVDRTAVGLLYIAMSDISMDIFDVEKVFDYSSTAAEIFKESEDFDRLSSSLFRLHTYYYITEDYEKATAIIDTLGLLCGKMSGRNRNAYFLLKLNFYEDTGNPDSLSLGLETYLTETAEEEIDWLNVSESYLALGNVDEALSALHKYEIFDSAYKNDPVYYIYSSAIYESMGSMDKALAAFKKYAQIVDSTNMVILNQDTKYLRDRFTDELRLAQARSSRATIILVGVILISLLGYTIHKLRAAIKKRDSEKHQMELEYYENYTQLKRERDRLSEMVNGNSAVDPQFQAVLNERLEILNKFFAAIISKNQKNAEEVLKEGFRLIEDRDKFLFATRKTFAEAHPGFISFLEDKGLSESQIEYCCLFAIGLRGKEIGAYLNRKRHYLDSSSIREKLGLGEHDTNLGKYLKDLLKKEK